MEPLVAGLATAVVCLGVASLWLVLGGFYFAAACDASVDGVTPLKSPRRPFRA